MQYSMPDHSGRYVLLCGDFNARVASEKDHISDDSNQFIPVNTDYIIDKELLPRKNKDKILDSRGKDLIDLCISNQLRIANGRVLGDMFGNFTCHTPNGSSTVDYMILSESILDQILYFKVSNFIPTMSDTHCKLEWELLVTSNQNTVNSGSNVHVNALSPNFIWDDNSAYQFAMALGSVEIQDQIHKFNNKSIQDSQTSIDDTSTELANIILSAASRSLKRQKIKHTKNTPKHKKWVDQDLRKMRANLINYGKVYSHYSQDPFVKNHFYKLYRNYNKARKQAHRQYKQSLINQLENLHTDNPKLYWNLIRDLQESKSHDENSSAIDPSTWFSHFQNLNTVLDKFKGRLHELQIQLDALEKTVCFNELDMPIKETEISKGIAKLKLNKSAGIDNISNNMLKHGQSYLLPSLRKLFNTCLCTGKYPESWAEGYITPIHKSNDITDPNNYRGITVTSAIGKLFNSILNSRLDEFLVKNNLIHDCQIGFTKKARTSDHMFIIKCIFEKYCNSKNGRMYACFVDFQKAFDTVIHTGIKIKLLSIGVGTSFYNIIKNMYNRSKSCVKTQNGLTDFFPVKLGVKQGDNLSPNLFKLFINDLPDYLKETEDAIILNNKPVQCLLYADDLVLLSTTSTGLQKRLNILQKFCQDWCLTVNPNKTKVLVFNKAGRHICENFLYENKLVECVANFKYLGLHFSASGSFSFAQNELYKKALKAYYKLNKNLLSLNPGINTSIHVFDHTIKPILLYGSEIWGSFNTFSAKFRNGSPTFDKIYQNLKCERLHTKFCRLILGVHKKSANFGVLSELGRFPLYFDIVKAMINFWYRLENLDDTCSLLKDAYITSKNLFHSNKSSWYGSIQLILEKIPELLNLKSKFNTLASFKQHLRKTLHTAFVDIWYTNRVKHADGKLRTYVSLKSHFGREKYLSIMSNFEQRRSFTRLRISSHRLKIETGRYQGTLPNDRICSKCDSGDVEDENHFLFHCDKFNNDRDTLFQEIVKTCPNFSDLLPKDKLIWLMNTEDKRVLIATGKFISKNS